jgi:hypothetical protein
VDKYYSIPSEAIDVSYVKELDASQIEDSRWSTLDLCGPDSWTLILGRDQPTSHVSEFKQHCDTIHINLNVWRLGDDFNIVKQVWFGDELVKNGGVLVRPDQHILTRVGINKTEEEIFTELKRHIGV